MNRRQHLIRLAQFAGAAGLPAFGHLPLAHAQSYTMKLSATTQDDMGHDWLNAYKTEIEAATQGKVKGQVYPASQLGTAQRTVEGVSMGTVEMVLNASGFYEGLDARLAALSVPGMFDSLEQGNKVMTDPEVRKQLASVGSGKGVELLTVLAHSQCSIVSRKPIRTLADFKGQKLRVPGSAAIIAQLRALGANPVAMSLGEVLPAFQNGTLDGVYSGLPIPSALKYYDVAKAQTLLPSTYICIVGLVSPTFMKSTGPLEATLREAAKKVDATVAAQRALARTDSAKDIWVKGGGEYINLNAADTKTYLDTVIPVAMKELNPEGQKDFELIRRVGTKYRS